MNQRERAAQEIERLRPDILRILKDTPAVYTSNPFRIVFDKPEQIDVAIRQLRAERVSPEEALNLSLMH